MSLCNQPAVQQHQKKSVVHLQRFIMATLMVGVVAGSGLVCMHSSESKEMANSKCALAFEDKKVSIARRKVTLN